MLLGMHSPARKIRQREVLRIGRNSAQHFPPAPNQGDERKVRQYVVGVPLHRATKKLVVTHIERP